MKTNKTDNTLKNDAHHTDDFYYRIPGEPLLIAGLGRALWNFLFIEETVVAILWESGKALDSIRSKMAGAKEEALKKLKVEFEGIEAPSDVLSALQNAIDAFNTARKEYRNALAHAVPYTVHMDENGRYQPGLKMQGGEGQYDVRSGSDMHKIALKIEQTINPLNEARFTIIKYMESFGRSRETNTP